MVARRGGSGRAHGVGDAEPAEEEWPVAAVPASAELPDLADAGYIGEDL